MGIFISLIIGTTIGYSVACIMFIGGNESREEEKGEIK